MELNEGSCSSPNAPRLQPRGVVSPARAHPPGFLRVLLSLAAVVVAAGLLLVPGEARAQTNPAAPGIDNATVDGTSLIIFYSDLLDPNSTPATSQYTVTVGGTTEQTPSSVVVRAAEVELTLGTAVTSGEAVTVTYRGGTTNVQSLSHMTHVGALTNQEVKNFTDSTNHLPTFSSNAVTLTVDENTATGGNVGSPVPATDPDSGDTLTYELPGHITYFDVTAATGQITVDTATLDFEGGTTSYEFALFVRDSEGPDGGGDSIHDDSIKVTVNVNDVNEPPAFVDGLTAPTWMEGTSTGQLLADYEVTDPEDDSLTWTLTGADASHFTINASTGALMFQDEPDFEDPLDDGMDNVYNMTVNVRDSKINTATNNGNSDSAVDLSFDFTVTVTNVNEDPDITSTGAGFATISVPENTSDSTVLATYTASDPDADDTADTLVWTLSGPDADQLEMFGSTLYFRDPPNFEVPTDNGGNNVYNVIVNVRDDADANVDDTLNVAVTVTNVDEPGMVTLPGTITAGMAATAMLSDIDGAVSNVAWQWSRSPAPSGAFNNISGATSASYTPVAADVGMHLKVTAMYMDPQGSGKSAISPASSAVLRGNQDPSFSNMSAMRSVDENSASGVNVGAAVSTTDSDGDALQYTLTGTDASSFTIDSNGQIKTTGVTYNYESKSSYSVTVNVRDNKDDAGNTNSMIDDTIAVTININNVDEPGTVTISGLEVGGETLTASVTDIDGTITGLSWRWQRQGSGSNFNNISGATSNTYAPVAADVGKRLKVKAMYTDPQGSGKSAEAETGAIGSSNSDPAFPSSETGARSVAENTGANMNIGTPVAATDSDMDTLHYTLGGTDASDFDIDASTGRLKTKSALDHEADASYTVTVSVSDNKDAAGDANSNAVDDTVTVTITVTDVNEAPVISSPPATRSIPENSTAVYTFASTDVDASDTRSWSVENADDGGLFTISGSTGALSFTSAPDFETPSQSGSTDNRYVVTVKITDAGGLSDTHELTVTVTNINEAPDITTDSGTYLAFNVDENTTTDTVIKTYMATDVDAGSVLTWLLEGNDAGDFNITKNAQGHGDLTFANVPNYEMPADADTLNDYDLTVKVRDNHSGNLTDTVSVAVTVEDVNETPVVSGTAEPSFMEIEYDATLPVLTIGTYTATDDEGDTMSWAVTGTDAAHFSITSTGVLSFSIRPDFENPADLDDSNMMGASNNAYDIVVEATDDNAQGGKGGTQTGTYAVTVTVTNVDETPEIPAGVDNESFEEIQFDAVSADLDLMTYTPRDEETSDLTNLSWSLGGTDAADFEITEDSTNGHGTLSFRERPNYEEPTDRVNTTDGHVAGDRMYEVIVMISDGPNTRKYPLTVTVTNVNETPIFTVESTAFHRDEIEYDSGITAQYLSTIPATDENQFLWYEFDVRDEEGDDIIFTLTGADAEDFVLTEDTAFMPTADADERAIARWAIVPNYEVPLGSSSEGPNAYVFTVNASDGFTTREHSFFIQIINVNEQPSFTGTPETAITLDEHDATLDANFQEPPYIFPTIASYTAHDEEGGVTWSLTGTDAGDFEIDSVGAVTFKETPSFEDPRDSGGNNVYEFNVVVTDVKSGSTMRSAMEAVTVTVQDIEETGVIQVDNVTPAVGEMITFALTDPDGDIDTDQQDISWTLRAQESGVWQPITLGPSASTMLVYTVDEDDAGKPLRAEVTYYDRRNADRNFVNRKSLTSAETQEVLEDPAPNVDPRFREGSSQSIEEGPAGRFLPDRITATDRDGDSLTYAIEPSPASAFFEINPSTGQIEIVEPLDFETAGPGGILVFTVTVHDGKGLDSNDMVIPDTSVDATTSASVVVIDVEEEGVVTFSHQEPEAGTQVTATLTDGDGGVTGQMWEWWRSANGSDWSPIPNTNSSTYTPTVADEDFYLQARVTYTDSRGPGKPAEGITGPVPSENRRPLFPSTEDGRRTIDENSRSGANIGAPVAAEDPERDRLTYTLTGTDAAAFTIVVTTGQIRVAPGTTLDFETKSSYSVTVEVHDGLDGTGMTSISIDDTQSVTITVENLEEPGTVTLTSDTGRIQARVPVTAALEDDDGPTNIMWQWARSPNGSTNWSYIGGPTTSDTFTPDDSNEGGFIRATASYNDGEDSGKSAVSVPSRVAEAPPVNSAPVFPSTEDGRREVAEDAGGNTAVGAPVEATDFNNDSLTYSLSGTDAASFTIDSSTGQIRVATDADLDFETKRTLRVTVEVTDGRDDKGDDDMDAIDDRQNVTITLTDVNEAPVVTGDETPSVVENLNRAVATYTAADPERDTLTWTVNDDDNFWISQRGQLYFRTPPSFEVSPSYSVTVMAEDEGGLSHSLPVTVAVTDVEEDGVVTVTPLRGWEGTRFEAELDDDDGNISNRDWQWQRSSNRSSWQNIATATSSSYTATGDDVEKYLRATVTYTDDRGSNKDAEAAPTGQIEDMADRPSTNTAPVFTETSPVARSIGQGTAAGRSIGAPVRATDADTDDVLTYSLDGADAGLFDIDPATGQLRTWEVLDYNPDGDNEYEVTVNVHDGYNPSYVPSTDVDAMIDVTITVTQVAQRSSSGGGGGGGGFGPAPTAPSFVDGFRTSRELAVNALVGDAVGEPVAATHPNDDDVTYSLSGANATLFTVDEQTGQIRLGQAVTLALGQTYTVNVTATDSTGTGAIIIVDISVTEAGFHRYDANNNGSFEKEEVIKAVADYFAGLISKQDVLEIVIAYFGQ